MKKRNKKRNEKRRTILNIQTGFKQLKKIFENKECLRTLIQKTK